MLNVFFMRFGHHPEAWRHPANRQQNGRPDIQFWLELARRAEAARFDTFFVADFIGRSGEGLASQSRQGGSFQFEPFTLLSAAAAVTQHIGLVATVNTNFAHPYNVARQFTSLDHISGGRAGWNIVSSLGTTRPRFRRTSGQSQRKVRTRRRVREADQSLLGLVDRSSV